MSGSGLPPRASAVVVAVLLLPAIAAGIVAGGQLATADRIRGPGWWPTKGTAPLADYVGAAACRDCHPAQSARQPSTSMARTAGRADRSDVLRETPQLTFNSAGYAYSIVSEGARSLYRVAKDGQASSAPLTWAFGDGKVGQSYLFDRDGAFYEARVSYFRSVHTLDFTPGRALAAPRGIDEAMGRRIDDKELRRCFACHTTASTAGGRFDPSSAVPGITCEACHGPGRRHAEVMKRPQSVTGNAPMLNPATLRPEDSVDFCGACHATFWDVTLGDDRHPRDALTALSPQREPLLGAGGRAPDVHGVPRSAPPAREQSARVRRSLPELPRLRRRTAFGGAPGTGMSGRYCRLPRLPHAEVRRPANEAPVHRPPHTRGGAQPRVTSDRSHHTSLLSTYDTLLDDNR